ncbi:MAG: GNAT family N-acetyltransferase, partial [Chloroflexi bacterium]
MVEPVSISEHPLPHLNAASEIANRLSVDSCYRLYQKLKNGTQICIIICYFDSPQNDTIANMKIAPLDRAHIDPWAALLATAFNRQIDLMHKLLDYLITDNRLLAWGAWDGSHLAAQYSCLRHHLHIPNQSSPVLVGMSINMAVHPDFRGQGLIKQVSQPVYKALKGQGGVAGVGFSNAEGVKVDRRSKGYGYRVLGQLQPTLAWIRSQAGANSLKLTTEWPDKPFTEPINPHRVCFQVTPSWIFHRYALHPFRHYPFGVWETAVSVRGLVVFRPFRRGPIAGV